MKKAIALITCLCALPLFGGSVRLYNDSPFKLRAVIRGADGTYLGEMVVLPEHFVTWSSLYPSFGPGGQNVSPNPNRSLTPYTVYWSCLDGGQFGIDTNVPSGGAALAESSEGPRMCKPKEEKERTSPYGPREGDEQLHEQNEAEEEF